MEQKRVEAFRKRLEALAGELRVAEASTAAERAPVELDQQSIGRLSRMDAMQIQAMAAAQSRRRTAQLRRIEAALRRCDEGEFGFCTNCGEEIAARRLQLDPATPLCVDCAETRS